MPPGAQCPDARDAQTTRPYPPQLYPSTARCGGFTPSAIAADPAARPCFSYVALRASREAQVGKATGERRTACLHWGLSVARPCHPALSLQASSSIPPRLAVEGSLCCDPARRAWCLNSSSPGAAEQRGAGPEQGVGRAAATEVVAVAHLLATPDPPAVRARERHAEGVKYRDSILRLSDARGGEHKAPNQKAQQSALLDGYSITADGAGMGARSATSRPSQQFC